ncbi:RNA 2',3'-cyclic phosphodiesterase [Streptomyces antimicrobicus]|uniref:RNA 2',3'-cyclic phosphodiesterase n=1 Tax=Streptomyces antimicrobicus TaxID=2883108 RepID=A0ABS8B164_9ACTN|nr:RNA 2',3'-cyclic phosphodiesterase [Streptomyces antimicrobicus]MCB5178348.1 RNA 2',3'-cyclic phosphodiesterase [Streptomyces antimicrobicus]
MRLFAAVLPPPAAVAELREALGALPRDEALRWTAEAGWHFTLAFMGEVGEPLLPELRVRLERAAARTAPFSLRLHGSGRFAHRALWTGAAGDIDALRMLAERADAAARRAGVPMEQHRRYQAHLTVARARTEVDLRPYVEAFAGFEGTPWPVEELHLVRSNLPGGGVPGAQPRYEVVASWPLRG